MDTHIPVVAFLMPLILSSWRTIDGVPLTSQRNTNHKLIEFSVEEALNPSLSQFQTFFFKHLLEDRNSDVESLQPTDKQNEIFHQYSTNALSSSSLSSSTSSLPSSYSHNTETLRQILRSLKPKQQHRSRFDDDTLSSMKFEHDVIHAILHNRSHPVDIKIPHHVRQAVKDTFLISEEPVQTRSSRSKRGSQSQQIFCQNRGSMVNGYLKLCKTCHVVTYFRDNYYPTSVNEVVCGNNSGESEKTCLSGRGRCGERRLQITRYRQNRGRIETQRNSIRVGCECELDPYSNIATLA